MEDIANGASLEIDNLLFLPQGSAKICHYYEPFSPHTDDKTS